MLNCQSVFFSHLTRVGPAGKAGYLRPGARKEWQICLCYSYISRKNAAALSVFFFLCLINLKPREKIMEKLKEYFEKTTGTGVLATADSSGKVDAAIYSRPHFLEEGLLTFIMRDRLTHHNLQSNHSATFLFIENGAGYHGKRLFLKKVREENNPELIKKIKRRKNTDENEAPAFLVYFALEKDLPLVGDSY
jgi:hypothetical protein